MTFSGTCYDFPYRLKTTLKTPNAENRTFSDKCWLDKLGI